MLGSLPGVLGHFGSLWSLLQAYLRLFVAGAKLEEAEVRSVASNQSEMEFSALQDMVRRLCSPSSCDSEWM